MTGCRWEKQRKRKRKMLLRPLPWSGLTASLSSSSSSWPMLKMLLNSGTLSARSSIELRSAKTLQESSATETPSYSSLTLVPLPLAATRPRPAENISLAAVPTHCFGLEAFVSLLQLCSVAGVSWAFGTFSRRMGTRLKEGGREGGTSVGRGDDLFHAGVSKLSTMGAGADHVKRAGG